MKKLLFPIILLILTLSSCQSVIKDLPISRNKTDLIKIYTSNNFFNHKVLNNTLYIYDESKLSAFNKDGKLLFSYKSDSIIKNLTTDKQNNIVLYLKNKIIFIDNSGKEIKSFPLVESDLYDVIYVDGSDNVYLQTIYTYDILRVYTRDGVLIKEDSKSHYRIKQIEDNLIYCVDNEEFCCFDSNFNKIWKVSDHKFNREIYFTGDKIYSLSAPNPCSRNTSIIEIDKKTGINSTILNKTGGLFHSIRNIKVYNNKLYYYDSPNIFIYDLSTSKHIKNIGNIYQCYDFKADENGNIFINTYDSVFCMDSNGKTEWTIRMKDMISYDILDNKVIINSGKNLYIAPI